MFNSISINRYSLLFSTQKTDAPRLQQSDYNYNIGFIYDTDDKMITAICLLPIQGITSKISTLLLYNFSITTNITIFTQNEGII